MSTTTEAQLEQSREEHAHEQELALADLELTDERAGEVTGGRIDATSGKPGGGCEDEFGCGSNHNEVLAVTA